MKKTTYILLEMLAVTASNALRCKPGAYYETYIVVDEGRFYIQDSGAVEDRQMPYSSTDGDKGGYIMGIFGPKGNKKALGERSQAIIIFRLLEAGYNILTPYGDNTRYDLVIEDADEKFWRIQCKTGWVENDGAYIAFKTASSYYHTRAGRTGYGRKDY